MKKTIATMFLVLIPMLVSRTAGGENAIIATGAKIEKLAGGFEFTEGPASDSEGNVFFTDQPNDRILKWSTQGKLSTFMQPCGRSNGLCFDRQNNLWACADEHNQLWCIDPAGKVSVVVKDYRKKLLNGPNDVWIRPDGGLYLTDPFYPRPYWKRGPTEQDREAVYYLSPDRRQLHRVVDDMKQPNGIIGTPDGKKLYVADIGANETYSYDIQPDGTLVEQKLVLQVGLRRHDHRRPGQCLSDGPRRDGIRPQRQADRAHRRRGALDGQRVLRRPGSPNAVDHGEQGALCDPNAGPRSGKPVAFV